MVSKRHPACPQFGSSCSRRLFLSECESNSVYGCLLSGLRFLPEYLIYSLLPRNSEKQVRLRTNGRARAMIKKKEIEKNPGMQPESLIIILWHSSEPSVP